MTEFGGLPPRIDSDPESVERGLVTLVLTLVELLRQLMERQALRRVDQGDLSDEQIERIGTTLMLLEQRMDELREHFGLTRLTADRHSPSLYVAIEVPRGQFISVWLPAHSQQQQLVARSRELSGRLTGESGEVGEQCVPENAVGNLHVK